MDTYNAFIDGKLRAHLAYGIDCDMAGYPLFDHQRVLSQWAARKGRSAIFADTGLGKTRMQLVWADQIVKQTGCNLIILAPLAVAAQTQAEGASIGVDVTYARDGGDVKDGINITNYDRVHKFDCTKFGAVVLDESSIIKHHDAKTLAVLMESFSHADYKLCTTATPAPNDWAELGTHAQFLGICTRQEMLSEYFTHDGGETQKWRLKGHARADFWRWVSSWGAMIQSPSDLGFDASAYDLPPLVINQVTVASDQEPKEGELFARDAQTLSERRQARRDSMVHRVSACADMVNESDDPWVIWCELNAEGDALRRAIPDAVEVRGSDTPEHKEVALRAFADGGIRVLVTKPKIAGFGLNWQHCANVAFLGVTDSYEAYYQAIRRCWRFGQKRQVNVHLFVSNLEGAVRANLERKTAAANELMMALKAETSSSVMDEIIGQRRVSNIYGANHKIELPVFMRHRNAA